MSACPFCSEEIAADAAECPSCGMEFPGPSPANGGDVPPAQPSKSNAKKWILIGGAGCGFCLLILACLAAFLLPMVSKAGDAARELEAAAAANNEQQVQDSDEQLMEMESVGSEDALGSDGDPMRPAQAAAAAPVAALKKLGADGFENADGSLSSVSEVSLINFEGTQITDAGLVYLKALTNLQELYLSVTQVTDAGLVHLWGLSKLLTLGLGETKITDAGVAELQKALPNCKIFK